MIRLTINAQSDPEIHLFNKSTILMGADANLVDLVLAGASIQAIHLKIVEQNGFLILINQANDPFASVNGHPFGKKLLNSGDVILVQQHQILFENLATSTIIPSNAATSMNSLAPLLQEKLQKQEGTIPSESACLVQAEASKGPLLTITLPFEAEVEALKDEEWKKTNLELYLNSGSPSQEEDSDSDLPLLASSHTSKQEHKKPTSLKDDYLRDLEDDNQLKKGEFHFASSEPSHLAQAWKWIIFFILSVLTISGLVGTVIYFSFSDRVEAQEIKAAQGVSDFAMALTHAKLYRLKPHNQNWADADFLKNNLLTILPDTASYANQVDAQGQFNCCPYTLRIYTNSDLSHFLLIAQPAPSILHWLIPKSTIVVDSAAMELRTLKDLRSLNRLLANPDPLEGINGKEISTLVKQGGLIRLSTLAAEANQPDFAPPKNLGWVKPGAENFIYNAPRYYRLGQSLMQKAVNLSTTKGTSQEVAALKQDVESFSNLNHFVIYADQGRKHALLTRQGLATFAPSDKILFGYLLFNNQGKIYQVHLLKEDEELKDPISLLSRDKDGDQIALGGSKIDFKDRHLADNAQHVDFNHPIYIQLQALTMARENELTPLSAALHNLLNHELQHPNNNFQIEFQTLSHTYLMADAKHRQSIKEALEILYHQYEDMPANQFIAFVKQLRLDQLIQQDDQTFSLADENCAQNIETMLVLIEKAKSLAELDNLIHIANTWLNFDYVKDPEELIKYQNLLRNSILAQLEKQLLSQTRQLSVKAEDRDLLQRILSHERLIKSEERDFFLEEFDELLAAGQSQQEEPASEQNKETPL